MGLENQIGAVIASMKWDITDWNRGGAKIKNDIKDIDKVTQKATISSQKLKTGFKVAGIMLVGALTAAVSSAAKFNRSMANIATLMPTSTNAVIKLKDNIQDLSIEFGKTTQDIADGAYQVVSAFGETAAEGAKIRTTMMAATAGMSTATEALNLLSAVTKGYGDTSDEAYEKAADLAFETVRLGQTTFPQLAASIGKTVPVAAKMGMTTEELFGAFATLTGVTGDAAEVSTQLSGILRALIKPTEGMKEAIKKLGFQTSEEMIQNLGLVGSMRQLIDTTDGTSVAVGKLFRRAEALTAVFALTGGQAKVFDEKFGAMNVSMGASGRAFNAVTEGINKTGHSIEQAKQRLAIFTQHLGDALIPAVVGTTKVLMPIVDIFKYMASGVNSIPGPIREVIGVMAGLTTTATLLFFAKKKLLNIFNLFPAAIKSVMLRMGPYIAALAAGAAACGYLKKKFDELGNAYMAEAEKLAGTARKEKEMLDMLLNFRRTATAEELKLLNFARDESHKAFLDEKIDFKDRLRLQVEFMANHSDRFKKWYEKKQAMAKAAAESEKKNTEEELKEINNILEGAAIRRKEITLDEFSFRLFQVKQNYEKEKEILEQNNADQSAFLELKRTYAAELEQIEKERADNQTRIWTNYRENYNDNLRANIEVEKEEKSNLDIWLDEQQAIIELKSLEGKERELANLRVFYNDQKMNLEALLRAGKLSKTQYTDQMISLEKKVKDETERLNKEEDKNFIVRLNNRMQLYNGYINNVFSAFSAYISAREEKLDAEYEKEKERIENNILDENERKTALEALDAEYQEKKRKMAYQAAVIEKAQNISSAIMNTAAAVTAALKAGPFIGPVLAGIIAALGAVQIALIARTPVPMHEGGMAKNEGLALLEKNEVVVPLEKVVNNNAIDQRGPQNVNFYINSLDPRSLKDIIIEQVIPVLTDLSRKERFTIHSRAVRDYV